MAGTPLALERSYGCLNCDYWDYGDGQELLRVCDLGVSIGGGDWSRRRAVLCVAGCSRSWAVARGREPGPAQAGKRADGSSGGNGLGAEGDEVGVVGGGEGVDGLGGGEGLLAECFGFAALCGVEDEDVVSEGGDAGVVPERTSRSVQRLAFRGRCPARVLRYSQGHAASRGRSARIQLR